MKETTTTNEIAPVREIVAQKVTMQMLSELPMGEKMRVVLPDIWAVSGVWELHLKIFCK